MTDRHSGYVVVLSTDIREDDAVALVNAIGMLKGVTLISPIVSDPAKFIAEARRDELWRTRLIQVIDEMRSL